MKKYFKFIYILLAIGWLFSCETEHIMYDSSNNYVAFTQGSVAIAEQGGLVGIPVIVTAELGSPAITVDFMVDADQSVAELDVDYTLGNDPMTLQYTNGWGYDTIWVTPVDNEVFGGNISFQMKLTANSLNYQFGAQDSIMVTIVDNEHPLKKWIGSYSVEAQSYGSPGEWDEAWTITTEANPDDISALTVTILSTPYGGPGIAFNATFDTEAKTITIPAGTDAGDIYAYGPTTMWVGDYETLDKVSPIIGSIDEDGTIRIDGIAMLLVDEGDYYWDAFNTTWTKDGKSARLKERQAPINKLHR